MDNNQNYSVRTVEQFSWKGFISRAILVLIFVLLLMWLVPMPNIKKLESKVDNVSSQVSVITDRIFNQNITDMKDAAKDYFTIQRLPKKVGDKVKISLSELIDKKLLLSVIDNKGKACNYDDSYVEIKRLDKEYEMKTYLSCKGTSDYILSYMDLECNLSCNNECSLVEKEKPVEKTSSYMMYQFKKIITNKTWTNWSNWTTEVKKADDTKTKIEYKGKMWVTKPVYKYEHTKTIEGEEVCEDVIIPGVTKCENVSIPEKSEQVWVPGENKTCPVQESYYETISKTCTRSVPSTTQVCSRVAVGSYTSRSCKTCALETHTRWETQCTNQISYSSESYDCSDRILKYKTVYKDCSTEGYYKTVVTPGSVKEVCNTTPDTTEKKCTKGDNSTETIWTFNQVEEGYTATGNKEFVRDDGYYIYTNWTRELPSGYTEIERRTLYSYRYYKTTTEVKYTWNRNKSIGDGWEFTGVTKEVS